MTSDQRLRANGHPPAQVKLVCFDVGYTILDLTPHWVAWGKHLGLDSEVVIGRVRRAISERQPPAVLLRRLAADRGVAPRTSYELTGADIYSDVAPTMERLRHAGLRLAAAGNMSSTTEHFLARAGLGLEFTGSSERWGLRKPASGFFERITEAARLPPEQIVYVGDRLDNDVHGAVAAGLSAIWLRRGIWADELAATPELAWEGPAVDSLAEVVSVLGLP